MGREMIVPDRTDPIVAWRVWGITDRSDAPLVSVTQTQFRWIPYRRMEAVCICKGHERAYCDRDAVVHHCCGLHATREYQSALGYYSSPGNSFLNGCVFGQVSLWGRVIEHENGVYRAEFAYPKAFAFASQERLVQRLLIQGLAQMYGVEAIMMEMPWLPAANECQCVGCQQMRIQHAMQTRPQTQPMPPSLVTPPSVTIPPLQPPLAPWPQAPTTPIQPNVIIQPPPPWPNTTSGSTFGTIGGIGIQQGSDYIWNVSTQMEEI